MKGDTGSQGTQGPIGPVGPQGPGGSAGGNGPQGPPGPQGPAGAQGPQGPAGQTGPAGATGQTGQQGQAGATGQTGPAGQTGPTGATGAQGPAGLSGLATVVATSASNSNTDRDITATCPAGKTAIGGAAEISPINSVPVALQMSQLVGTTQWIARARGDQRHGHQLAARRHRHLRDRRALSRPTERTPQNGGPMRIHLTSIFVDDQAKALEFYTNVLGFQKKNDIPLG